MQNLVLLIGRLLSAQLWGWVKAVVFWHWGWQSSSIHVIRSERFSLDMFSPYGKRPLWERLWQLLLPSQFCLHFLLLENESELFYWYQTAAGALQVQLWPVVTILCRVQAIWKPNWLLVHNFELCVEEISRNYILAVRFRSIRNKVNIWVGKGMEYRRQVLCTLFCRLYRLTLLMQDLGAQGERKECISGLPVSRGFFFARGCQVMHVLVLWALRAVTHQAPFLNDDNVNSIGTSYSGWHFWQFAYSVLYLLYSAWTWSWIIYCSFCFSSFFFFSSGRVRNGSGCRVSGRV